MTATGRVTPPPDIDAVQAAFAREGYVADRELATSVFLALALGRPLLLEGEAGVGKTEVARTLAAVLGAELIRLQCYEGLDASTALYEWDYPRQMLEIRLLEARGEAKSAATRDIFGPDFLIRRPLLRALESRASEPPVLLIDEVDRADEEFEAFLLEILSDFAVSIPEIGTIRADRPPRVILTSNRTREVHDALKRRCLYQWLDYPEFDREVAVIRRRIPGVDEQLAKDVATATQRMRGMDLLKPPGLAEAIDWTAALTALGATAVDRDNAARTLGAAVKYHEDRERVLVAVSDGGLT